MVPRQTRLLLINNAAEKVVSRSEAGYDRTLYIFIDFYCKNFHITPKADSYEQCFICFLVHLLNLIENVLFGFTTPSSLNTISHISRPKLNSISNRTLNSLLHIRETFRRAEAYFFIKSCLEAYHRSLSLKYKRSSVYDLLNLQCFAINSTYV